MMKFSASGDTINTMIYRSWGFKMKQLGKRLFILRERALREIPGQGILYRHGSNDKIKKEIAENDKEGK